MFAKSLKFVAEGVYKFVLPLSFSSLIFYQWNSLESNQVRVLMCCAVVLFARIENSFAPFRFYKEKSQYEYEITILLTLVKIINSFQTKSQHQELLYLVICDWAFDILLFCNVLCYILAFILIIMFAFIVLVGLVRGDPAFINPRRGLSIDELSKITRKKWSEYQEELVPMEMQQHQQPQQHQQQPKSIHSQVHSQMHSQRMPIINNEDKNSRSESYIVMQRQMGGQRQDSQEFQQCSICLDEFKSDEIVVQLPVCKHAFHGDCIDEWLMVQPQCPFCRNNVRLALLTI